MLCLLVDSLPIICTHCPRRLCLSSKSVSSQTWLTDGLACFPVRTSFHVEKLSLNALHGNICSQRRSQQLTLLVGVPQCTVNCCFDNFSVSDERFYLWYIYVQLLRKIALFVISHKWWVEYSLNFSQVRSTKLSLFQIKRSGMYVEQWHSDCCAILMIWFTPRNEGFYYPEVSVPV